MNQLFLSLALVVGSSLTPLCCWAKMDDLALHSDTIDFQLSSAEACVSTGQIHTGHLSAYINKPGWTITSITFTTVIDGHEVPPPVDLYTNSAGTSNVNASGNSGFLSGNVRDAINNALDDGQDHAYGGRVTIHMNDDQGVAQTESITTNITQ